MKFDDRYSSAVRSSNLRSKADTNASDSDVLGAAGLAAKKAPLALALLRLFSGDNHAALEIVRLLGGMADGKAYRLGIEITRLQAEDMGRKVLAWVRDGVCKHCGGHGVTLIEGAPALSDRMCQACKGTRRVPFEREFSIEQLLLAQWLLAEVEREAAVAGPMAMARLAPRLDL